MIPGLIGENIRRSNRNLLISNIVLVAVLVGSAVLLRGFLYNFFSGPLTVNAADIPKMGDPDSMSRYWVRVVFDPADIEENGWKISGDKRDTAHYKVLDIPKGRMLMNFETKDPGTSMEGELTYLTSEANEHVVPNLEPGGSKFLPVMVDQASIRQGGWWFCIIWSLLMLLGIWNILKAARRASNPALAPVCHVLKRFGEPAEIAVGIDAEYKAGAQATGNVQLTQSWLMRRKAYGLDLVYLGDAVWAYRKEVKRRTNGVYTGTTFSSVVRDKYGKSLDLVLKKEQVDQLLANIHSAVPWVIVGYDKKLDQMWNKKRRPELLQVVEKRKADYLAAQQPASAQAVAPPVQG
jgi:hypothetical protein